MSGMRGDDISGSAASLYFFCGCLRELAVMDNNTVGGMQW